MTSDANQFAYIYCRVAGSDARTSRAAFKAQELVCRSYASQHGLDVIRVFTDVGSGFTGELPELSAMIDRLESGTSVIVQDIARLSRSVALLTDIKRKLAASGAHLCLAEGKLRSSPKHVASATLPLVAR